MLSAVTVCDQADDGDRRMNGILLLDKPSGWTSNDAVQKLRGVLHERRIGHSGTLDPMATGLLTVFVGRATRAVEFAEADDKTYIAGLRLGISTDTQDITGTVISSARDDVEMDAVLPSNHHDAPVHGASRYCGVTKAELEAALEPFRGSILQTPPMYSALRINGKRLYDLARQGKTVERQPRRVTIQELSILNGEGLEWTLRVRCSKGTYIRTLCNDIGERLGCGGCMSSLRRTDAGLFSVEHAATMEEVLRLSEEGKAESLLLPVDRLFAAWPELTVSLSGERLIRNGNPVPAAEICVPEVPPAVSVRSEESPSQGIFRVYSEKREFLALGRLSNGKCSTIKSFFEV